MSHTQTIHVADTPRNRTLWDEPPAGYIAPFYVALAPEELSMFGGAQRVMVLFMFSGAAVSLEQT